MRVLKGRIRAFKRRQLAILEFERQLVWWINRETFNFWRNEMTTPGPEVIYAMNGDGALFVLDGDKPPYRLGSITNG
jgi:hypothetical protein